MCVKGFALVSAVTFVAQITDLTLFAGASVVRPQSSAAVMCTHDLLESKPPGSIAVSADVILE
jgi:hypothetical protein